VIAAAVLAVAVAGLSAGGPGVVELVIAVVLVVGGLPLHVAIAAALVTRALTFWAPAAVTPWLCRRLEDRFVL